MENEVSDYIKISAELIITALILTTIVGFASIGYATADYKSRSETAAEYMNDLTDLYWYNDRVVTASDALELMMTYPGKYDYYFEYRAPDGNLIESRSRVRDEQLDSGDATTYWSEKSLRSMIDGYEKSSFNSELIKNPDGYSIGAIKFTYQEG